MVQSRILTLTFLCCQRGHLSLFLQYSRVAKESSSSSCCSRSKGDDRDSGSSIGNGRGGGSGTGRQVKLYYLW